MLDDKENGVDFEALAGIFTLLSNPIRLQILDYLLTQCCKCTEGSCSVTDIYTELQLPQPLISKHLKLLKEKGVLDYTRHGNKLLYRFAEEGKINAIVQYLTKFEVLEGGCCI